MENALNRKKRALKSDAARAVRQKGYDDALEFALLIGLTTDYQNNPQAKKDVIDPSGDAHSVKGGEIKWQVFLYGAQRFKKDYAFLVMNGIGQLLSRCIDAFPLTFDEYQTKKIEAKTRLQVPMRFLVEKFSDKSRLAAFLNKSLFNGGEVNYLTVKLNEIFHVFLNTDVIHALSENLTVDNSKRRAEGQMDAQKVVFKYKGVNLGELEMRNESIIHYREIRFNMIKTIAMKLLFDNVPLTKKFNDRVFIYGNASKKFGRWSIEERKEYNKKTSGEAV